MFKRSIKYFFLTVLIMSLGFFYGFTNHRNDTKSIVDTHITFTENGARFLSVAMVNKLLIQNQNQFQKQAKSRVDLYRLEKGVIENPYVESSSVYTTINGELFTVIKERTPIARVLTENDSYYLDKKGVKMPLSLNYSARVPLITGISGKEKTEELYNFLRFINEDDFLRNEITGVQKVSSDDYFLTVRSGDYRINFGSLNDKEKKFKKLKVFYSKALLDETIFKYKTINLKFHNQVVGIK